MDILRTGGGGCRWSWKKIVTTHHLKTSRTTIDPQTHPNTSMFVQQHHFWKPHPQLSCPQQQYLQNDPPILSREGPQSTRGSSGHRLTFLTSVTMPCRWWWIHRWVWMKFAIFSIMKRFRRGKIRVSYMHVFSAVVWCLGVSCRWDQLDWMRRCDTEDSW